KGLGDRNDADVQAPLILGDQGGLNLDPGAIRMEGGVNVIGAMVLWTGQQVHLATVPVVEPDLKFEIVADGPAAVRRSANMPVGVAGRPGGNLPDKAHLPCPQIDDAHAGGMFERSRDAPVGSRRSACYRAVAEHGEDHLILADKG